MRTLIASLVGMVIIFAFQAMSWMVLPTHKNAFKYSKDQDAIMAVLSQNLHEDGMYHIPSAPPEASMAEHEDFMKKMEGKPWAIINYHTSMSGGMGTQMVFGLIFNLLCILLVVMVLNKGAIVFTTFSSKLMLVMTFSVFLIIAGPLMTWNWWGYPTSYVMADIIDLFFSWLLCGLWLAWYLGRRPVNS